MFVFEFEKPLFEFVYERPHCEPLLALPPTFSSSIVCTFSALLQVFVSVSSSLIRSTGDDGTRIINFRLCIEKEEACQGSIFILYD